MLVSGMMRKTRTDLPHPLNIRYRGLTTQNTLCSHFQTDSGDLVGECVQLMNHTIDSFFQIEHLALDIDVDLLAQISECDGFGDFGYGTDLIGEVGCHFLGGLKRMSKVDKRRSTHIDISGQISPSALYTFDFGLTTEYTLSANF